MLRVLLVDDDDAILEALVDALSDRYAITVARDGVEALAILGTDTFDVILLDLMMPVMDGESFMAEAQARGIKVPVVIVSAARDAAARALAAGAAESLSKPYRLDDLIKAIDRVGGGNGGGAGTQAPSGAGASTTGGPSGGASARRSRRARADVASYF
ncbi:MAG TPA: response regulator [Kofleriaceae bacterium]|jgi:CheY-like chemotaxis protein|nr:response regulator [Kofleriaceae bacterium]